ncbi:MAG: ABC transporter ATP-binding protein [Candidatus Thermoplasmatota archaeon]|nr:ABC transporter ATP-binding protein [Candidatus Thermoplasmatota archaeon]
MIGEVVHQSEDNKTSSSPHLSAMGVTVRFGPVVALDDFTVEIPRGIIGLLGPNGAGKSTFIKASLGLVSLDKGRISVSGLDSQLQYLQIRDDIGYMPEHDCLIPNMSSVELVSYMGKISGMSSKDAIQRTHEVLDFVGIGEERYRLIKSYSTGMKQRIKLAQAVIHDPSLLFLDEPTSGMDPNGREEMLDLIKKIGASEKTVIVSSHILQEVELVCEYAVIISNGKLVRQGKMEVLMAGEEDLQKLTVRGGEQAMTRFIDALAQVCEIMDRKEEGWNQIAFTVRGCSDGKRVFKLAHENGVQIRRFHPDKLSLEDVFLSSFKGGGAGGN